MKPSALMNVPRAIKAVTKGSKTALVGTGVVTIGAHLLHLDLIFGVAVLAVAGASSLVYYLIGKPNWGTILQRTAHHVMEATSSKEV